MRFLGVSKFIFNAEMRLVFRFEVFVGAAIFIKNAPAGVSHDRVLCFVCARKYLLEGLQLFFCKARLTNKTRREGSI